MRKSFVSSIEIQDFALWDKMKAKRALISFDLEVTARCNSNCRHCCINLPAADRVAKERELSLEEIERIAEEAVSLGALWCLVTGGEPLLREDFLDIYLSLRQKGLLVSVFTNATRIKQEHIRLFKKYPPRDIEVTVYGITEETYEQVTRRPGSFADFVRGLDLLLKSGITVRLKAMALRSNVHELPKIAHFCKERTKDYFRFDPFLHLRFDRNPIRNEEIKSERLSPGEIVAIERSDPERFQALEESCKNILQEFPLITRKHLFRCGAGNSSFVLSSNGLFRLCSSLWCPDCVFDLKDASLHDAWNHFVPRVRRMRSDRNEFLELCQVCPLFNICMWCPAHAYLEVGETDAPVDYFCKVAHTRAEALKKG